MEAAANRLQKEAKGYLDSLRGVFSLKPLANPGESPRGDRLLMRRQFCQR